MRPWEFLVNLGAVLLFLGMLIKAWVQRTWEQDLVELLIGFGGVVLCLFPHEASDYSGHYGWTRNQWRVPPVSWTKAFGIVLMLLAAGSCFTGSQWLDELVGR